MENLRNGAGELISQPELLNKFKISIFWIIWYEKGKDEADIIEYLNSYRQYQMQSLSNKPANDDDYKIAA